MRFARFLIALLILTVTSSVSDSAATLAQTCQSGKNKAAGKYDYCRQRAEGKYATTGDGATRTASLQKCLNKYNALWPALEMKAGGNCPSVGDQAAIQNVTDEHTTNIATALAGGTLQDCPADLSTCNADLVACESAGRSPATGQTTCWSTGGVVIPCAGTGQDGDVRAGAALAYTDNGDGTITDANTGLMWEKQSNGDFSVHDMGNVYTWDQAFSVHVAALNGASFAGHTDWRVPNVKELMGIVNYENASPAVSLPFNTNCTYPCTVLTCSCTAGVYYWSSSSVANGPTAAWNVNFDIGLVFATDKSSGNLYVRAVRGGT